MDDSGRGMQEKICGRKGKTFRDVRSEEDRKPDVAFERLVEDPSPRCARPPSLSGISFHDFHLSRTKIGFFLKNARFFSLFI